MNVLATTCIVLAIAGCKSEIGGPRGGEDDALPDATTADGSRARGSLKSRPR